MQLKYSVLQYCTVYGKQIGQTSCLSSMIDSKVGLGRLSENPIVDSIGQKNWPIR